MKLPKAEIKFHDKFQKYFISCGRETFYDENNYWIMFDTPEEARRWFREKYPNRRMKDDIINEPETDETPADGQMTLWS